MYLSILEQRFNPRQTESEEIATCQLSFNDINS